MAEDIDKDLAQVVERETVRYSRLCWWADPEDVRALIWQCALEAKAKYVPTRTRGSGIKPLATVIIRRTLSRWRLATRTPAGFGTKDRDRHGLGKLSPYPVPLESLDLVSPSEVLTAWRSEVTKRLEEVVPDSKALETLFAVVEATTTKKARRAFNRRAMRAFECVEADKRLKELWDVREE